MGGLETLIESVGYVGVLLIIFSECGVLFGIFLPGDTLLFTAGLLARQDFFDIYSIIIGCVLVAFFGNLAGYEIGRRYGLPFARKYASRFVSEEQLDKTNIFFNKYGITTIIIARFTPLVRTIVPFLAGVIRMKYSVFVLYSAVGAVLWAGGLPLAGYYLGTLIPQKYLKLMILPVIGIIVLVMVWPYLKRMWDSKRNKTDV